MRGRPSCVVSHPALSQPLCEVLLPRCADSSPASQAASLAAAALQPTVRSPGLRTVCVHRATPASLGRTAYRRPPSAPVGTLSQAAAAEAMDSDVSSMPHLENGLCSPSKLLVPMLLNAEALVSPQPPKREKFKHARTLIFPSFFSPRGPPGTPPGWPPPPNFLRKSGGKCSVSEKTIFTNILIFQSI